MFIDGFHADLHHITDHQTIDLRWSIHCDWCPLVVYCLHTPLHKGLSNCALSILHKPSPPWHHMHQAIFNFVPLLALKEVSKAVWEILFLPLCSLMIVISWMRSHPVLLLHMWVNWIFQIIQLIDIAQMLPPLLIAGDYIPSVPTQMWRAAQDELATPQVSNAFIKIFACLTPCEWQISATSSMVSKKVCIGRLHA